MKQGTKSIFKIVGGVLAVGVVGGLVYAKINIAAFDASVDKVYDVPVPPLTRSTDPVVLARGKHLAESVAACASRDCHGTDFGGGNTIAMGPVATMTGPNITMASIGAAYSDGELARLIKHGVKKDGRTVRFMPAQDFGWLPDSEVTAIISYLRSVPNVERENGPVAVGPMGKVLDRQGKLVLDVARRIDHAKVETVPAPEPTVKYGQFLARLCTGCHGEGLSGGKIPGVPPSFPTPLNLTPDKTGLAGWTQADYNKLVEQGLRRGDVKLDKFMPYEAFGKMDSIEKQALFSYLMSLPPRPFGGR